MSGRIPRGLVPRRSPACRAAVIHPRGITALLFCLLAAVGAVACEVTPPPDDTVVAPAPRSSAPHAEVTPSAVPTTARQSATPAPSAPPTRSAVPPSPANDCATRDLVLTSDKPRRAVLGNPGDVAMDIRLRNRSGINCVLDGWPGVDFVGGKAEPPRSACRAIRAGSTSAASTRRAGGPCR
ncbi:DUF4232 domain-containing protein [Streptomyces sp. NPDC047009]|uniref:DUF4232 domain-containing protein n=1 Tax=Streptomyces sp. NPDC047009 TaxID=3154496 RepID=UPI0033D70698